MADQRTGIRMSDKEAWAFIGECRNLQFATLNKDGSPHQTTLWFGIDDEAIFFDSYVKAQKAVNVLRDPRVSLLFEKGIEYGELRGVAVSGKAELVKDSAQSVALVVPASVSSSVASPLRGASAPRPMPAPRK